MREQTTNARRQFASLAKVKSGWGYPSQGVLALDGNRLVFVNGNGSVELDTTLDQCKIWFPGILSAWPL
jgi:hypothetical protein